MKRTKIFALVLAFGLFVGASSALADNRSEMYTWNCASNLTIHIDGAYLPCDVEPVIIEGRTLMPLRAAGEALGASADWNNDTRTAILTKGTKEVRFTIGSSTYYVNGIAQSTDVAPQIVKDRTMIPLRVFAETLDTDVTWNQAMYDVAIDTPTADLVQPTFPANAPSDIYMWLEKYYVPTDSADGFAGTWHFESSFDTGDGNVVITRTYYFISKLGENYQFITLMAEDMPGYDDTIITIVKNDAWRTGDTTLRCYNVPNIAYFYGPARGFTYEGYSDFEYFRDALIQTGYLDTFGSGEHYTEMNEPAYHFDY